MRVIFTLIFSLLYLISTAQFLMEEKVLTTSTGDLKGTLIVPAKAKKFKLVIIQPGSGATDRNGNSGKDVTANSYKLIAEELAAKNIATLLVDKRGIAGSMKAIKNEASLIFDDYADDLAAWVRFIKTDKRIQKIFIAGHSEGSLVGMIAAQKEKVNGYISIAGAGESIDKIIVWQYAQQLPKAATVVDSLFKRMKANEKIENVPPYLLSIFRPSLQPYIKAWISHDPCEEIKKLTIPILIIQGSTDIQVQIKQAEMLKACKLSASYKLIEGMNHILKQSPLDRAKNIATYSNANLPLMPELAEEIIMFIKKN